MINEYINILKHPKWQRKRLEILSCADWMCEKCKNTEICLHVHHKKYISGRKPWEYPDSNFMVLCELCHWEGEVDKYYSNFQIATTIKLLEWYKTEEFKALKKEYEGSLRNTL